MLPALLIASNLLVGQVDIPSDINAILHRADSVNTAMMDSAKFYSYEFTEKIVFEELGDSDFVKKVDTTISRVTVKNGEEVSRMVIYPPEKAKEKKPEKEMSAGATVDLSPDNPDYNFALVDSAGDAYAIKITPKKNPQEKEQIDGIFYIEKNSFLATKMDFTIPRPKDVKKLQMLLNFIRLDQGPFVISNMQIRGLAAPLFGLIKIKFKVIGEFYDYSVIDKDSETH